ncbi:MAG: ABC transporter ATP-binding protein [Eubacteriales bacterium]
MKEKKNTAIEIEQLNKVYKLYEKPKDRLKEALGLLRKKTYKEHYALKDVSLSIQQGETVGIIGTNGSGKSTILKIITGVLNQTSGSVAVNGRISALLELGAGFHMEYTGIENIYLNGTMIGFSEAEITKKLDSILEFADIGEFVHQPVKTYSSGMFVRLAFAVAINIEPEILIVDEALSVGDVFFQAKCYHKFEEFKKMGKTILFVSHDLSSISKYCDRVILLNKGVKLGEGSPKEMVDIYKRVLVGQYNETSEEGNLLDDQELNQQVVKLSEGYNKDRLEYGTKEVEMTEMYLLDEQGICSTTFLKQSSFTVVISATFHKRVENPIIAFTIKDVKGVEITGTNTVVEKAIVDPVEKGRTMKVSFTQKMSLQGGDYLLSLGVTGYEGDLFQVYHRLYDVINFTVISDKNTVGYYDMDSKIRVEEGTAK